MKKIYYLMAFVAVAIAFTACNPMDSTYKQLGSLPTPTAPAQKFNYTLTAADYKILPSTVYASSQLSFLTTADANQYVPTILNSKYGTYTDGSSATVTFAIGTPAPSITLADSVYNATVFGTQPTGLTYTLVNNSDYLLLPGNKFADFSVAQMLTWLPYKYTAPVANQLEVLTWIFYPTLSATAPQIYPGLNVSTTSGVTTAIGSFLYLNGAWIQAYHLTPAQYAAVGRGQYNQFTSSDDANLVSYFNGILKADASVTATATVGSIQYVSFNYYSSGKVTSQRVIAVVFDGTNWGRVTATTTATATFTKANGVWIGDPTVYYTLGGVGSADNALIVNSGIGSSVFATTVMSDLTKYGDFDTAWTTQSTPAANSFLNQAFIMVLTKDFPTPKANVPYKVTFLYYTGGKDVSTTYTFTYSGGAWVAGQ